MNGCGISISQKIFPLLLTTQQQQEKNPGVDQPDSSLPNTL